MLSSSSTHWFAMKALLLFVVLQSIQNHLFVAASPIKNLQSRAALFQVKESAIKAEWTPIAQLGGIVATAPNTALYWSGRVNGISVFESAQRYAVANGKVTLEMALVKAGAVMPVYDVDDKDAVNQWTRASELFAQGASGDIQAFVGRPLRVGNIYESAELPALKKSAKITSITEVSGADPTVTDVVFSRTAAAKREEQSKRALLAAKAPVTPPKVAAARPLTKPVIAAKPKLPVGPARLPAQVAAPKVVKKPVAAPAPLKKPVVAPAAPAAVKKPVVAAKPAGQVTPPKVVPGALPATQKVTSGALPAAQKVTPGAVPATQKVTPGVVQGKKVPSVPGCATFVRFCL